MGLSRNEVLEAMFSNQMNARAYAYTQYGNQYSMATYQDYGVRASYLANQKPGYNAKGKLIQPTYHKKKLVYPSGQVVNDWYRDYRNGKAEIDAPEHKYDIVAPPGIRIWMSAGGINAIADIPEDVNWRA